MTERIEKIPSASPSPQAGPLPGPVCEAAAPGSASGPVRIAQVIGNMTAAGVEAVVFNYYGAMDKTRFQFDFYYDAGSSVGPRADLIARGARFFEVPSSQRSIPGFVAALTRAFRRERYPIVHAHLNALNVFPLLAAKRAGVPVRISHSHSTAHPGEGLRTLVKYALRPFSKLFPTDLFACGELSGRWLYGEKTFDAGRVTVFQNAVDREKFAFDPAAREALRASLHIPADAFTVGHIGRFVYQKNHAGLIDIFCALKALRPDAVLLLAGNGPLEDETRALVSARGLSDAVRFLGVRNDANLLYSAMDAFCLPSFYEGLPVVGVEAQMNGVPCCFSAETTAEIVQNENVRRLPLADGPERWAKTLLSLSRTVPGPGMDAFDIRTQGKTLAAAYTAMLERGQRP